jgi:serine protease Do
MTQPVGSIISEITPDSPAEKAGLRNGDVIVSVGSKPAKDTRAVMRSIAVVPAGSSVPIGFWRGGKEQELAIAVADWPTAPKLDKPVTPTSLERPVLPNLGLQVASFNDEARNKYGIDFDQPGLLVTSVARNTDAADRGLVAGDVILQIQDHQVSSPAEFEQRLKEAREDKHSLILVLIQPKLAPETQAQTAGMPGAKTPTPAQSAMGLQWGPPKWVVLRVGNG